MSQNLYLQPKTSLSNYSESSRELQLLIIKTEIIIFCLSLGRIVYCLPYPVPACWEPRSSRTLPPPCPAPTRAPQAVSCSAPPLAFLPFICASSLLVLCRCLLTGFLPSLSAHVKPLLMKSPKLPLSSLNLIIPPMQNEVQIVTALQRPLMLTL